MQELVFYTCCHADVIIIYDCPKLIGHNNIRCVTICPCNSSQSGILFGNDVQMCAYSEHTTIKNIAEYFESLFDHEWNRNENWQNYTTKLSKKSCEFLLIHFGFIPSVRREWNKDDIYGTSYPKLCYQPKVIEMTTFVDTSIPKALVDEMSFVIYTRNELSKEFPNYEPKLSDFPKPLRNHVHNAINVLSRGGSITNILYIAIYEFLGIHITNYRMIIHNDFLLQCPNTVMDCDGTQWTLKFDPPASCLIGLTGGELEFISDHVVRVFQLILP